MPGETLSSPRFFVSWAIWQQMTLILGGAIVVVFVLGLAVKEVRRRKTRRLEIRAVAEAIATAERGEVTQVMRPSEEVPFGVRANEAGHEVEGVWNSKTNTPLQTITPTSSGPPTPTDLTFNKLKKSRRNSSISTLPKITTPDSANFRWSRNEAHDIADVELFLGARPGLAHSSTVPNLPSAGIHIAGTNRPDAPSHAVRRDMLPDSNPPLVKSLSHSHTFAPPRRSHIVIIGGSHVAAEDHQGIPKSKTCLALEQMQAHRLCHTAETGQLQPRMRPSSGAIVVHRRNISVSDNGSIHSDVRTASLPPGISLQPPGSTPRKPEIVVGPEAVSCRASIELHHPASTKACPPSAWTPRTDELVAERLIEPEMTNASTPDDVSHLNRKTRRINDGFEILPMGTLEKPSLVKEFGSWPEPMKACTNEQRQPRKLQRRNRSSSGSCRSSSESGRSASVHLD